MRMVSSLFLLLPTLCSFGLLGGVSAQEWNNWEQWSGCSVSCGEGIKVRTRVCSVAEKCPGTRLEIESCNTSQGCPKWTIWTDWTSCSSTCGVGAKERTRNCDQGDEMGSPCSGPSRDFSQCDFGCPCPWAGWRPNQKLTFNNWGQWGQWSACSVTCGSGQRRRCRSCAHGSICTGPIAQSEPCRGPSCRQEPTYEWSQWSRWSECSASCGEGTQTKTRNCIGGSPFDCSGSSRTSATVEENQTCNRGPCQYQPDFIWGQWQNWGRCSRTCGGGSRTRARECIGGTPDNCRGMATQKEFCGNNPCPPPPTRPTRPPVQTAKPPTVPVCPWNWAPWSPCLGGCGGVRTRQPSCGSCGGTCTQGNTNQFRSCGSWKCNSKPQALQIAAQPLIYKSIGPAYAFNLPYRRTYGYNHNFNYLNLNRARTG